MRVSIAQSDNTCHRCRQEIPKGTKQVVAMLNYNQLCTYHPECRKALLKELRKVDEPVKSR